MSETQSEKNLNQSSQKSSSDWFNFADKIKDANRKSYTLNGHKNGGRYRDTLWSDTIRLSDEKDIIRLRGSKNSDQGDIVYMGEGNDKANLKNSKGRNSIYGEDGNDIVIGSLLDGSANLGAGKDIYTYNGGTDMLTLGAGRDHLKINNNDPLGSIVVSDFKIGEDRITGLSKKAKLLWDSDLNGFSIVDQSGLSGRLHTGLDGHQPETWIGLAMNNSKTLGLASKHAHALDWRAIRDTYSSKLFNKKLNKNKNWAAFQSDKNLVRETISDALNAGESQINFEGLTSDKKGQMLSSAQEADSYVEFMHLITALEQSFI
jgi:hypothetical protein